MCVDDHPRRGHVLVGLYHVNDPIPSESARTQQQIRGHRAGTQKANKRQTPTEVQPAKPANSSGLTSPGPTPCPTKSHEIWILAGTLKYPPICPPTRMLRQHVSQECTQPIRRMTPCLFPLVTEHDTIPAGITYPLAAHSPTHCP